MIIVEQGNGWPDDGAIVTDGADLYRLLSTDSGIQTSTSPQPTTGFSTAGRNWVYVTAERADDAEWDSVFPCLLVVS